MKIIFVLFSIIVFHHDVIGQSYFSNISRPPFALTSFSNKNFLYQNDTLITFSHCFEVKENLLYENSYLTHFNADGKLMRADNIGHLFVNERMIKDGNKIIVAGSHAEELDDGKLYRNFDSIMIFQYEDTLVKEKLRVHNHFPHQGKYLDIKLVNYNDQYILYYSDVYESNFRPQGEFKPYIYWINKDFTLDTVMQLDLPYGGLFDYGIDKDGNLNIFASYHTGEFVVGPTLPTTKHYQGYIKLDKNKKIVHSFFYDSEKNFTKSPSGICYEDGTKGMTNVKVSNGELSIVLFNAMDSVLWTKASYRDQSNIHYSYTKCQNGDMLVVGENTHNNILSPLTYKLRTSFIQRLDKYGNEKFNRSYGYFPSDGSSSANRLLDIKEISPNRIYAIGWVINGQNKILPGFYNDSTWILHVDSLGCIDKDKCNDVIAWNAPNNLYQYDQMNVRHKEWYFSNDKGRFVQSFGRDTNMFDRIQYGWLRHRPIIYKNLDTGVETKDTVFATWEREGKMFISPRNYNLFTSLPLYLLYDFTLKLHDTFTLPYNYGKAIITQVDSIALIPGYLRKRIVLQHLNPTNQAKYGDMVWIEGIGSTNGILYYKDWQLGTKTALTCYYDRGEKRFSSTNDPDCRKEVVSNFLSVLSPNHIWYAVESSGWSPKSHYQRYKVDVIPIVIGDKSYQQILTSSDSTGNNWKKTKKYVREDDGKLWLIDSTANAVEVCIMDMNLKKGDEFSYKVGFSGNTLKLLVSKVDTMMDLSGQIRKVIHLSCDLDSNIRYRWVEGIGPDVGVFNTTFLHCVIDGNENSLTCFYKDETQLWQSEDFNHCWKPSPPVVEAMIPILNSNIVRYVLINSIFYPHYKMERWKFNFLATIKENAKAYYELLVSEKEDGNDFLSSGRFFREEDNRFYQYISPSEGERLLYDMNLKAGDSIRMDYADGPRTMVVTKEDSIQLDDEKYRKSLTLQCVRNGEIEFGDPAIWIEGIGRLFEPFVDFSHCSIWDIARPEVVCMYDGVVEIYKSETAPNDCWVKPLVIDTTDMDRSTIWYSSSLTGNFLPDRDCELKIDITKVVRDTLIENRLCRIIGVTSGGQYFPESEIIEYSKDGKMYFYEDETWKLLYDFTAQVGDTVTYHISKKYPFYFIFSIPAFFDPTVIEDNPYRLKVVKIDTVYAVGGQPLKRYITHEVDLQYPIQMNEIIENVGSIYKLFGFNSNFLIPECYKNFPSLRCYSDDDTSIKFTEGECDKLTSTKDLSTETIKIHPNPGQDHVSITLSDGYSLPATIQISDIAGKILMTETRQLTNFDINTSHLISGLYIITIRDSQGKVSRGKWVKE